MGLCGRFGKACAFCRANLPRAAVATLPQLLPAPAVRRSCPERHYESTACMLNNGRTRTVADVLRRVSTPGETCALLCAE
eukprot:gene717-4114_t